jgi:hypothetical protein
MIDGMMINYDLLKNRKTTSKMIWRYHELIKLTLEYKRDFFEYNKKWLMSELEWTKSQVSYTIEKLKSSGYIEIVDGNIYCKDITSFKEAYEMYDKEEESQ